MQYEVANRYMWEERIKHRRREPCQSWSMTRHQGSAAPYNIAGTSFLLLTKRSLPFPFFFLFVFFREDESGCLEHRYRKWQNCDATN